MLSLLQQLVADVSQIAEALTQRGGCGRPLAGDCLMTREEVRAELRCSWERVDALLADCTHIKQGRITLYRWGDVLFLAERRDSPPEPTELHHKTLNLKGLKRKRLLG